MSVEQTSYSAVLGVVLRNLRIDHGIEQSDMAARMGLSQASYSRLEGGISVFSVDQMYQAAGALYVSDEEISNRICQTVAHLRANGVKIVHPVRKNSTQSQKESSKSGVGSFLTGATLGALLMGLLSKK
ncbi:helix-turn-helix domain-containing protein [Gynuella sp.]|uniref:helix-turn-helix domain-containing protein n=1 Tax=Gynuella sp. TaxID=2969146 RepID=UPI003D0D56A9